jgi:hypothetical protein
MEKKAMRNSKNKPVFISRGGIYVEDFPATDIIRKNNSDTSKFIVYGFVGEHNDFEERQWSFDTEKSALNFATIIYGRDDVRDFNKDGEVYEVEIHEVDA